MLEAIESKVDRGLGRLGARGRLWGGGVWPERRTAARLGLLCSVLREGETNREAKAKLVS